MVTRRFWTRIPRSNPEPRSIAAEITLRLQQNKEAEILQRVSIVLPASMQKANQPAKWQEEKPPSSQVASVLPSSQGRPPGRVRALATRDSSGDFSSGKNRSRSVLQVGVTPDHAYLRGKTHLVLAERHCRDKSSRLPGLTCPCDRSTTRRPQAGVCGQNLQYMVSNRVRRGGWELSTANAGRVTKGQWPSGTKSH